MRHPGIESTPGMETFIVTTVASLQNTAVTDIMNQLSYNGTTPLSFTGDTIANISCLLGDLSAEASNISDETTKYSGKSWKTLKQPMFMVVVLSIAYAIVFVLAVVNNSLVIAVIYRNQQLRTVTNLFIANLAAADILASLFILPITLLSNLFSEWWWGPHLCKAAPYLQGVAVGASVNTLAAVAVERYMAIFYPKTSKVTTSTALISILFIWIVPMGINIPWAVVFHQTTYKTKSGYLYTYCSQKWANNESESAFLLGGVFLTCYLIPLVFISICYLFIGVRVWKRHVAGIRGTRAERNIHRSKIRIIRMLIAVFVIFVLSWLPLYAVKLRFHFGLGDMSRTEKKMLLRYLTPFAQWLGAANSAMNPFIYCFFSVHFRRGILAVLRSKSCCGKIVV